MLGGTTPFATSYMVGLEDKTKNKQNNAPNPKNNAAVGYQGPVKIELLKGAGLLKTFLFLKTLKSYQVSHVNF